EHEAARQGEVLVQQAVALERLHAVGQERLLVFEPDGTDGALEHDPAASTGRLAHDEADRPREDELVQAGSELLTAPDEEGNALERELLERRAVERPELEAQRRAHRALAGHVEIAEIAQVGRVRHALELERPEDDVVRRSVLAGSLLTAAQVRA